MEHPNILSGVVDKSWEEDNVSRELGMVLGMWGQEMILGLLEI